MTQDSTLRQGGPPVTRLLCPVDFSETSAHAVEQAVAIAGWYKARITALHVYPAMFMPVPGLPLPQDRVSDPELQRARGRVEEHLAAATRAGIDIDVSVVVGQAALQILDCASRLPADMIVMGTHGAGGFEHLVLGSVAEKVLRKASCPVLTVPPRAKATSRLPFERLLCSVDFSDWSLAAVELAASLAQESGALLTLLHVVEWPWHEPPAPQLDPLSKEAAALAEFRRYLEKSAGARLETLVPGALKARCTTRVGHGTPYREILRVATDQRADLLVVGVHGRNPVDMALFGSTTNQVVRHATCPVLTLRR
jgi:nucleotide-binding universal stress UspA family protein